MIKIGTSRFCIVGKHFTYKFAIGFRGLLANYVEYRNYCSNSDIVAYTEYHWWGLKQETLVNTITYDRYVKKVAEEHRHLFDKKLHNRMQVGQDSLGKWKYFDYEDVKFYINNEGEQ